MILLNYLPFLSLAFLFWTFLYLLAILLERFLVGSSKKSIVYAFLNLFETSLVLVFSFVYILNQAFFELTIFADAVPLMLVSVLSFYFVDSIFHLLQGQRDYSMIIHHLISIVGCIWMISMPRLWFEAVLLVATAKITFQYYLNNLVRGLGLHSAKFLRINAWWNWNLFWIMRIFAVPFICTYSYFTYNVPVSAGLFLIGLNLWGLFLMPRVWKYNRSYLETASSFSFWDSLFYKSKSAKVKQMELID